MTMSESRVTKVVAPSDLEAGYTFDATVDGKVFKVTVPEGGVKQGQEFEVPYPEEEAAVEGGSVLATGTKGEFKHGLLTCFDVLCKGLFWMGLCCTPILEAQVMTRLNLNWCGKRVSKADAASTYGTIVVLWILTILIGWWFFGIMLVFWIFYSVIYATRLRGQFRKDYEIPPQCCGSCEGTLEDCLCAFFCNCCSACQMERHTHDEDQYPYQCCTPNGKAHGAPDVVSDSPV